MRTRFDKAGVYFEFLDCPFNVKKKRCKAPQGEATGRLPFGFPHTKIDPIDEAAMMLLDNYDSIKAKPNEFKIWAFHFPHKGSEADLLYWHSLRAKPYLDIQAMLIHSWRKGLTGALTDARALVTRVFVFHSCDHILELRLNAFMTLFEQQKIGIECFYTSAEWFEKAQHKFLNDDLIMLEQGGGTKCDLIRVFSSDKEIPYGSRFSATYDKSFGALSQDTKDYIERVFIKQGSEIMLRDKVRELLIPVDFRFDVGENSWKARQKELWEERGLI